MVLVVVYDVALVVGGGTIHICINRQKTLVMSILSIAALSL